MSEEKLLILKMLENGTISSEEAVSLLDALNEDASDINIPIEEIPSSQTDFNAADNTEKSDTADSKSSSDDTFKDKNYSNTHQNSQNFNTSNFEKTFKKLGKTFEQLGDKFEVKMNGFSDEVEKKINNNASSVVDDLKNFFGTSGYGNHSYEFNLKYDITSMLAIDIATSNGKIVVNTSDDDNLYFSANFYAKSAFENFNANEFCDCSFDDNIFKFKLFKDLCNGADIKLSVPKRLVSNISLISSNAKIVCDDLNCNNLDIHTSNAKIILTNCNIETGDLKTSNGKINLDVFDVSNLNNLNILTSNSKILATLKNINSRPGIINLITSNAKIDVDIPSFVRESDLSSKNYIGKSSNLDLSKPHFNLKAITSNSDIYFE